MKAKHHNTLNNILQRIKMHNLPTNNETNIIRNIFNVSTQLNKLKSLKEATNPTYGERVSQAANETGGYVDPRAVEFSPEEQEDWARKAKMGGTDIATIRAEEINKAAAKARQDKRAKEAEESEARVKAWQSSPEYQKQVEADRAKAAARKESKAAAEAAKARQDQVGPGGGVGSVPSGPGIPAGNVEMGQGRAAKPDTEGFGSGSPKALIGKIWGGEERSTGAYDNTKEKSWLDLGREAIDFLSGGLISMPGTESARERAINTAGKAATERQKVETSKPEYVEKQTQDWRMLPQLVRTGKMKKEDAHKKLKEWETLHGTNDDIAAARKALDASQEPEAEKPWYDPRGWFGESTENYYYHRLANLFEETSDQPISGVNPAAYGYTPKGQRKARLAAKGFAEPMKSWAGDSTVEAPDLEPESTERPHIDTVVAPHIETLVRAAAQNEINLSHGEAFDPRSKDHQRLIIKTKDPAVMKASEAIRQIRKDYGMED